MKQLYFLLLLLAFLPSSLKAQESTREISVEIGETVQDSLLKDSSHAYRIALDSATFVSGQVFQESVDAVVTVLDPEKKAVASFDGPALGMEPFQFDTQVKGTYTLMVTPFEEAEGAYSFTIQKAAPVATEPPARIAQLLTRFTGKEVPGGAVMVMKDGGIIFKEGYGMASLTYGVPFKPSVPTNIGSTSKQFTAFAIMLLAEQEELSLDDDIRTYFPELPDFGKPVTIRHLLTHTSGYREFLNTLAMTGKDLSSPMEREKLLEIVKNQPELQNEPGAEWNYNNTGFALMSLLVEKVTETPFPEWMDANVFRPLGMNSTQVRKNQNAVIPGRSQGYTMTAGGYEQVRDLAASMGAGGIYSTVEDLAKWIRNFEDPEVGSKAIIKEMTTPFVLTNGDTTSYGLGLFLREYKGLKTIQHAGADAAHRSELIYFPEIQAAVVTQSNNSGFPGSIAYEVAEIFFKNHMETGGATEKAPQGEAVAAGDFQYNTEEFDVLAGRYELEAVPGFILSFHRDGDRIFTQATGQPEVDLLAVSDSVFRLKGVDAQITFHLKDEEAPDSLTLHQHGDHIARRISWEPAIEDLQEFTGRYFSEEIQTSYSIALEEEELVLRHYILEDTPLSPGDEDSFSAGFPIADLSFRRDESGKITGFSASNGRTRGVFFSKVSQIGDQKHSGVSAK